MRKESPLPQSASRTWWSRWTPACPSNWRQGSRAPGSGRRRACGGGTPGRWERRGPTPRGPRSARGGPTRCRREHNAAVTSSGRSKGWRRSAPSMVTSSPRGRTRVVCSDSSAATSSSSAPAITGAGTSVSRSVAVWPGRPAMVRCARATAVGSARCATAGPRASTSGRVPRVVGPTRRGVVRVDDRLPHPVGGDRVRETRPLLLCPGRVRGGAGRRQAHGFGPAGAPVQERHHDVAARRRPGEHGPFDVPRVQLAGRVAGHRDDLVERGHAAGGRRRVGRGSVVDRRAPAGDPHET